MTVAEFITSLRLGNAILQTFQRLRRSLRRRPNVVFALRPLYSGWTTGSDSSRTVMHVRATFGLTNAGEDRGVITQGVQLRRAGLRHLRDWEDCAFWSIAGEPLRPDSPGTPLGPRKTTVFHLQHPFLISSLPGKQTQRLGFRVRIIDQLNQRHRVRVQLRRFDRPR